jgi:fimbrial chaperone protein
VNELPDPPRKKIGTVNLAVCYMIPVFFRNADVGGPEVGWRLKRSDGSLELVGRNKAAAGRLHRVYTRQKAVRKLGSHLYINM